MGQNALGSAIPIADLLAKWRKQADDYMRIHKSMRCGCASTQREGYLKAALQLRECATELEAALHVEPQAEAA
jgi:hypothetical protein